MENNSFSAGLRELADAVDAHSELFPKSSVEMSIYITSLERAKAILTIYPKVVIDVNQIHNYVGINIQFGALKVNHVGSRDNLARPIIEDGKVKWVLHPELQDVLLGKF
jgi:hypothetical protein